MSARLNPYLGFRHKAREALEFYASVFGGTPTFTTFGEAGQGDAADRDKVMHGQLEAPSGLVLMASDAAEHVTADDGSSISLSLTGGAADDAELRGYWARLADGGTVLQPLTTSGWGDTFGMCRDRFGTTWLVNIGAAAQG